MDSHQVLLCEDIIRLVFDELMPNDRRTTGQLWYLKGQDDEDERRIQYRSLLNYTLVCRAWSGLALNIMWRELKNPEPLFKLFATFKHVQYGDIFTRISDATVGEITESEWERFFMYSRRVRHLGFHEEEVNTLDSPRILNILSSRSGGRSLFPNLQTANFGSVEIRDFLLLCSAMPTALRQMICSFVDYSDLPAPEPEWQAVADRGGIFGYLSSVFPHLEGVAVEQYLKDGNRIFISPRALRSLWNMRNLSLGKNVADITTDFLKELSEMPYLDDLDIPLDGFWPELHGRSRFSSPTRLSVWFPSWHVAESFLQNVSTSPLKIAVFRRDNYSETTDDPSALGAALTTLCTHHRRTLRAVEIYTPLFADENANPVLDLGESFLPLLAARDLETFSFGRCVAERGGDIETELSDDIFRKMGEAWPLLTKMVLIPGLRTYPSTKAFSDFLSRCPALEHLELEGLAVSPAEDVTITHIFHHLRFLALGEFSGDIETFAHFLNEVFLDPIVCKMRIFFQGDEEELEQLSALDAVITRLEALRGAKQAS